MEYAKNSAFFIRIIFMHFHIIALKVKFSMRRKNSHAESIMEESYEGNRNCTSDYDLGRVVIPKEIRRTLRIREGDPLEIFTDREGEIILKKYSPIGELAAFAGMYADSLAKEAGCLVCICDMDQVVAASGNGRKEVQEKYISKVLQGELEERNSILAKVDEKKYIRVFREQEKDYVWESITPIICEGDVVGAVILLSSDEKEKFTKLEQKLGACAAGFLGKQME